MDSTHSQSSPIEFTIPWLLPSTIKTLLNPNPESTRIKPQNPWTTCPTRWNPISTAMTVRTEAIRRWQRVPLPRSQTTTWPSLLTSVDSGDGDGDVVSAIGFRFHNPRQWRSMVMVAVCGCKRRVVLILGFHRGLLLALLLATFDPSIAMTDVGGGKPFLLVAVLGNGWCGANGRCQRLF